MLSQRRAAFKSAGKKKRSSQVSSKRFKPSNVAQSIVRSLGEPKVSDFAFAGGSLTAATGSINLLSGIAQGSDVTNRIGRKVSWKSLSIRFTIYQAAAGVLANVRALLVLDKAGAGTAPTWLDIMSTTQTETARNISNIDRFKILMDEYMPSVGNSNQAVGTFNRYCKIKEAPATFIGTTVAQGSCALGAMYLCIISDATITTATGAGQLRGGWESYARIVFHDV